MQTEFVVYDVEGKETGSFSVSFSKEDGLRYQYLTGVFCWQDVVGAISNIAARMTRNRNNTKKPKKAEYSVYKVVPDSYVEIRFSPILIDCVTMEKEKLPITIDGDEILEHSFHMSYDTAVKALLGLSMCNDGFVLRVDREKIATLNASRWRKSRIQVQL